MQSMENNKHLLAIEKNGFVNIPSFFEIEEMQRVAQEVQLLLGREGKLNATNYKSDPGTARAYHQVAYPNSTGAVSSSFLGKHPTLDQFAVKLFANPRFNDLCRQIAGENFRLYTFSIRQLTPKSRALGLHQDDFGGLTISIPLNDIGEGTPTTFFLPQSHRFPINISNIFFPVSTAFFKPFLVPHTCQLGDMGLFLNKTHHGAFGGDSTSTVVLINLVSEGFSYRPWLLPEKTSYGASFREAIGDNLFQKLGSTSGLTQYGDKSFNDPQNSRSILENENTTPVLLHEGLDGRTISVLPRFWNEKDGDGCLVHRAVRSPVYSPHSILLSGYLLCIKVWAYAKHGASKFKRFLTRDPAVHT